MTAEVEVREMVSGLASERDSSHMGCALSLALHVLTSQSPIDWGTPARRLSAARRTANWSSSPTAKLRERELSPVHHRLAVIWITP